jgi:tetratricopeptide (TPR) repeat protein
MFEDAIPLSRGVNGDEHSDTLHLLSNLGALYARTGRAERADSLLTEALSLAAKLYDENDFMRVALVRKYGECLIDMGRYDQAEAVLLQATDGLERNFGASHTATRRAYSELVRLYAAWGRPAEAERWRGKAEAGG